MQISAARISKLWQSVEVHRKRRDSMFTIPRSSLQNTLRWSRRVTVVILIIANLATVMLAGAARLNRIHNHNSPSSRILLPLVSRSVEPTGTNPFTNYTPSLGFYDASQTVTKQHIAAMQYGGVQAGLPPGSVIGPMAASQACSRLPRGLTSVGPFITNKKARAILLSLSSPVI